MLFTESGLRSRAQIRTSYLGKSAAQILQESRDTSASAFDIFLSHSILDREIIVGPKLELEDRGFTVYVDWISDPVLDRTKVTVATAAHLRARMRQCKIFVYVHSENAALSRWCPWELGYFDGLRGGNVFIMPISTSTKYTYDGQEYLGLYPYLEASTVSKNILIEKAGTISFLGEARNKVFTRKAA